MYLLFHFHLKVHSLFFSNTIVTARQRAESYPDLSGIIDVTCTGKNQSHFSSYVMTAAPSIRLDVHTLPCFEKMGLSVFLLVGFESALGWNRSGTWQPGVKLSCGSCTPDDLVLMCRHQTCSE